jgi:hypothetical protein
VRALFDEAAEAQEREMPGAAPARAQAAAVSS